jgi:hypothetical protein
VLDADGDLFSSKRSGNLSERAKSQRNHVLVADCARASSAAIRAIEKADRCAAVAPHAPMTPAAVEHRV